jgi:hypothetical protein
MAVETLFAQITPEAPSDSRRETALLPVCCMCGLLRDDTRPSFDDARWVTQRKYRNIHGVNPADAFTPPTVRVFHAGHAWNQGQPSGRCRLTRSAVVECDEQGAESLVHSAEVRDENISGRCGLSNLQMNYNRASSPPNGSPTP